MRASTDEPAGGDELGAHVQRAYAELRRLAMMYLNAEGPYHTLQPTALVHEAYLRLSRLEQMHWHSDSHFFAMAATQMRRVLVDHARAKAALKRGGGTSTRRIYVFDLSVEAAGSERDHLCGTGIELREDTAIRDDRTVDVLALDEALEHLAARSPRQARVAEMRLFSGMSTKETADVLGVSEKTIKGQWRVARAWLGRELRDGGKR